MKLFTLIEQLQNIYDKYGDLEVVKDLNDNNICAYAGYVSITGEIYSKFDFDTFPEDYPERKEFNLKKDLVCII